MEDIDLLPETLRSQSLSDREIVLPYDEALQALDILVKADWALLGWEGWEKDAEGRRGHSYIMGTKAIEQEPGEKWEDYDVGVTTTPLSIFLPTFPSEK